MHIYTIYVDGQVNLAGKINCKESQLRDYNNIINLNEKRFME